MTTFCMRCGAANDESSVRCSLCGEMLPGGARVEQQLRCPGCGVEVKPEFKFCRKCGCALSNNANNAANNNAKPAAVTTQPVSAPFVWEDIDAATAVEAIPEEVPAVANDDWFSDDVTEVKAPDLVVMLTRKNTGEKYELELPAIIGKGSAATCRIAKNSTISRTHLRVSDDGGECVVEDLKSTNGTQLNGKPLSPNVPTTVADGDVLILSDEEFVVSVS